MDKLQTIDRQRQAVQQRLDERLPRQHRQLAALVTATKWRLSTLRHHDPSAYTQELVDATTKKLRMEVGAFEYAAKEQSELLTRALFQLDDVLSHGDAAIKDARKALVLAVQQQLERADLMNAKATALKQFTERVIDRLPAVPEAVDEPMEDVADQTEVAVESKTEPTAMEQDDDDWEHVDADNVRALFASDDEQEAKEDESTEDSQAIDDSVKVQPEEAEHEEVQCQEEAKDNEDCEDDEEDEDEDEEETEDESEAINEDVDESEERTAEDTEKESACDDGVSLPVWRPYYQIQKRPDGVYLVANLHGIDPRHMEVQAMPHQGVLRIVGVKYPTQKDLLLSRLSGTPTFGRFEIVERFPAQMLSLENASQELSADGTLQVRVPYYMVHQPPVLRRVSPFFQPHRLSVW